MTGFELFPPEASTMATKVDVLFLALLGLSIFFVLLIGGLIVFFGIRYREGSTASRVGKSTGNYKLEFMWAIIPFGMSLVIFFWAANLFFQDHTPPPNSIDIYVVAKQWMWKTEQPNGLREINSLHVPVNQPVRLIMTSQDVIHSFYVPAFRIKQDVLPGRQTEEWFTATKTGTYHLFCAEYCGTGHSAMIGQIVVMTQPDYEAFLASGGVPATASQSPGEQLFTQFGCIGCHKADGSGVAPSLVGVYGSQVKLETGQTVTADQAYIENSIRHPKSQIVAGYQPVMPDFGAQISDTQLAELVAYIKSLAQSK